ncbi:CDP-glycerol glycerophosphotransferase [Moraxella oblonga]|uniref:CDP-glycerol glycerophosphotransferase n=1 Tax=Moraxella oblonga TaxID=200413 RepID=UPI00082ABF1A|nr:CDP-glycerol glycerophosphotransferase [Moraxella oblonga]
MTKSLAYFIYLDTKIVGAILQLCAFFERGVFAKDNTIVLVKKYKHKSTRLIAQILTKQGIVYRFVKENDLDELTDGVMFYPFNAQSNCRAVANRHLTHIFITHGESNKVSSIKPIIRIYDYVITAGQAGIERYLASGIFSQHDVDTGRIIMLGDTFIGRTGLTDKGMGQEVVFYAPTWEGGIERENYSSLSYVDKVAKILTNTAKTHQVDTIVIKPHPNTGHRLRQYIDHVYELAKILRNGQLNVVIFKPYLRLMWLQSFKYERLGVIFVDDLTTYHAKIGFCDISAVETQFLNEGIFYYLFLNSIENKAMIKNICCKNPHIVNLMSSHELPDSIPMSFYQELKNYVIFQEMSMLPINERIDCLLHKIIDK